MNAKEALAFARKSYGKNAYIQENKRPSSQDARDAAKAELMRLIALREATPVSERRGIAGAINDASYYSHYYRCNVGKIVFGMAFEVIGSGDNWQEAVDNAKQRMASGAL